MEFVPAWDPLLRRSVKKVLMRAEGVSQNTRSTCRQMRDFASGKTAPKDSTQPMRLVGLAAPQVGIDRAITYVNVTEGGEWTNNLRLLINPNPLEVWGEDEPVEWWHRCFSCETLATVRSLPRYLRLEYFDLAGMCQRWTIDGKVDGPRQLHVVTHEIEHLLGIRHMDVLEPGRTIFSVEDAECTDFTRRFIDGTYQEWPSTVAPEAWPEMLAGRPWRHLITNRAV